MQLKRVKTLAVLCALVFVIIVCFGCSSEDSGVNDGSQGQGSSCSVTFFDMGTSESVLLRFNDGKTMLVDCGGVEDANALKTALQRVNVQTIDYLVLTHPDVDHVGGAETVINDFNVGTLFIPKILGALSNLFPTYKSAVELAKSKGVQTEISDTDDCFTGEDYQIVFLAPQVVGGSYADFNSTFNPNETQVDNLSSVIYINIMGIRFLLTGDAGYAVEDEIISNYTSGLYGVASEEFGGEVNLEDIEFLKVAKGGRDGGTSSSLLSILRPKNAIVFTGDGASPSNLVLTRLYNANNDYNLYRTDVYGNITINILGSGQYGIGSDKSA